jgi:lysyl-tRNA synthetase class II
MGKLAFAKLADDSGDIQLYMEKQALDGGSPLEFGCASRKE